MAKKFIKTKSKYVLSKLHQDINNGKIFERDWSTIGGVDSFSPSQTPVYKSDNFIITVGNNPQISKSFDNDEWEKLEGDEEWSLDKINQLPHVDEEDDTESNNDIKIDYYSLRDFAYYGSCKELIRVSINNILANFPGELYAHTFSIKGDEVSPMVFYDDKSKGNTPDLIETKPLAEGKILLENPFNINLHTSINNNESSLKYFSNEGFKNYQLVIGDNKYNITAYDVISNAKNCVGDLIATIKLTTNVKTINVYAYQGEDNVYYFVDNENKNIHIRPQEKFLNNFFKKLDVFEQILLNRNTNPLYKASFEVISENDYGFKTDIKDFIFPIGNGGYNIGSNKASLEKYIKKLSDIASYYDEVFCDNLYRSLTHESIKNFDWTISKLDTDETEMYQEGLDKISKIIRVFGRAFDDLKLRIDDIKNINNLSYDSINNTKDDFIATLCKYDGWDIKNIAPYYINGNVSINNKVNFIKDYNSKYKPFTNVNKYGYFMKCDCDTRTMQKIYNNENKPYIVDKCSKPKKICYPIKEYYNDKEYTASEIFLHFLKMLKLNSRHLFRSKGTIHGLKEILALFGLKEGMDYTIKEYTLVTKPILDTYDNSKKDYHINWLNKTKTIQYANETYLNGNSENYIGLPVIYKENGNNRLLYPYFNQYNMYDGNPYFQMNGGWLRKKNYILTKNDYLIDSSIKDLYSETLRTISVVQNIEELINIPRTSLHENDIYYVTNLNGNYVIIDGMMYDIKTEYIGNTAYEYISVSVHSNTLQVGGTLFIDNVWVSNYNGDEKKYNLESLPNNYEIKIYLINNTINVRSDDMTISSVQVFKDGKIGQGDYTHYFRLNNVEESGSIGIYGWEQLLKESEDYIKISIVNDYFEGNNPHSGHMKYDNGFEYLLYFRQIFKYAYDNALFDSRYFDGDISQALSEVEDIGFKNLIPVDDDLCNYNFDDSNIRKEDSKIHYFKPRLGTDELDYSNYYVDSDGSIINNLTLDMTNVYTKGYYEKYNNVWGINTKLDKNSYTTSNKTEDKDTYCIVNTKWIDITFNRINSDISNVDSIANMKYFDSIVLNYLTQMIPSTTICTIKYSND